MNVGGKGYMGNFLILPPFSFVCMCDQLLQLCLTLCDPMDCMQPATLLCPWDSPGKNIGVGFHALLQGILLIQGSNPCLLQLLHCRQNYFTC